MKRKVAFRVFMVAVVSSASLLAARAILHRDPSDLTRFTLLLVATGIASRLKVRLPGLTATMSVNLPFLLIACAELGMLQAMCIACFSSALQSIPRSAPRLNWLQAIFNMGNMGTAAGLSSLVFRRYSIVVTTPELQDLLLLFAATMVFFLCNTLMTSTAISLTESTSFFGVWRSIFTWSSSYYLLSAGIVALAVNLGAHQAWIAALLATMCFVHWCHRRNLESSRLTVN